jgi:hypothetical protein
MISVKKLSGSDTKYCTHCDDPAAYELNYLNPAIIQQSSCGVLCVKCMKLFKKEIYKALACKDDKYVINRDLLDVIDALVKDKGLRWHAIAWRTIRTTLQNTGYLSRRPHEKK